MRSLVVIAHDIRSTYNVGALLRTADGFGVDHVYFTGVTPYPAAKDDSRLPHIQRKLSQQINKTALGAIDTVAWSAEKNINDLIDRLRMDGYKIIGLEQNDTATPLNSFKPADKCALLLGRELEGISADLIKQCDDIVEITMYGKKESFNVTQAAAVALYALREA